MLRSGESILFSQFTGLHMSLQTNCIAKCFSTCSAHERFDTSMRVHMSIIVMTKVEFLEADDTFVPLLALAWFCHTSCISRTRRNSDVTLTGCNTMWHPPRWSACCTGARKLKFTKQNNHYGFSCISLFFFCSIKPPPPPPPGD